MAGGRERGLVGVGVRCDGGGHIVEGAGEAAGLSVTLGLRSGSRRQTLRGRSSARETSWDWEAEWRR
jgi:hypothetical protein